MNQKNQWIISNSGPTINITLVADKINLRSMTILTPSQVNVSKIVGPLLFLVHINDITCQINPNIKLFVDDEVMYSEITTQDDISSLKIDINLLSTWSNTSQMNFN